MTWRNTSQAVVQGKTLLSLTQVSTIHPVYVTDAGRAVFRPSRHGERHARGECRPVPFSVFHHRTCPRYHLSTSYQHTFHIRNGTERTEREHKSLTECSIPSTYMFPCIPVLQQKKIPQTMKAILFTFCSQVREV